MKINKNDLLDVLNTVKPGLSKKEIVEQTTHFIFSDGYVYTYNDRICISCPVDVDLDFSVRADEFYKVLSKILTDEVSLDIKGSELIVKGGKIKSGLTISTDTNILDIIDNMEFPDSKDMIALPKDFIDGMELCMFSVSKDQSHPYLSNQLVAKDIIVSSDDSRVGYYKMSKKIKDTFLIPGHSVVELVMYDVKKYLLTDSWVYFITDDGVMFCSRIVSHKEGVEKLLGSKRFFDFDKTELPFPDGLLEIVDTSSVLASGDFDIDKTIEVTIDSQGITCKGEKKEIGWIECHEKVKSKIKEQIKFYVNPIFFSDVLKEENKTMYYGDEKIVFESDNFKHLISLTVVG